MDFSKFYDKLRVKALLNAYFESFLEYAKCVQAQYELTDEQTIGVIHMAVDARLSKLSLAFKKVVPIAASFTNIEDGDYIADVKELKLGNSKKGRYQVTIEWEIADGENAGKKQKQFYGLSDDKGNEDITGMGYWKNVAEIMGIDLPEDMNLWQEEFDRFVGENTLLFEITAKANGQYTNVYVNGASEFSKGEEGAEGVEEVAAEEVADEEVVEVSEEEVVEEVAEEVQQITAPVKKTLARPVTKVSNVVKIAPKVAAKPAVVAKPVAKVAVPAKKLVSLARR